MGIHRDRFLRKRSVADDEWADWLSDDMPTPEKPKLRMPFVHRRLRSKEPEPAAKITPQVRKSSDALSAHMSHRPSLEPLPTPGSKDINVSVNIRLPRLKIGQKLKKLTTYRKPIAYWSGFTVALVGAAIGVRLLLNQLPASKDTPKDVKGTSTQKEGPSFKPVVSEDNKKQAAEKHTYDPVKKLYSYEDELLKNKITVSQQPLPEKFKTNPETARQVAASIGASQVIDTAFGKAYIATSENKSSQRIMATHKDVLLFIESLQTYDEDTWKLYLDSLR